MKVLFDTNILIDYLHLIDYLGVYPASTETKARQFGNCSPTACVKAWQGKKVRHRVSRSAHGVSRRRYIALRAGTLAYVRD